MHTFGEFSWTLFVLENSYSWVNFRGHIFGEFQWTHFDGGQQTLSCVKVRLGLC